MIFIKIKKTDPNVELDNLCNRFFKTSCLSLNMIIQISRICTKTFSNFTYDPPQMVNRCYVYLIFVQVLFFLLSSFILLTEMKQIPFVCQGLDIQFCKYCNKSALFFLLILFHFFLNFRFQGF